MNITQKEYSDMVKKASPPSPKIKDFVCAFVVGGGICTIGQGILNISKYFGASQLDARTLASVGLVFLSALFTALGLFDDLARHAGAGTLVPITGFANAVVSPAIEYKKEGWVLGLGSKIFAIAGPVIAYGTLASVVYGAIYWIFTIL